MGNYEPKESYLHLTAKQLLHGWLSEQEKTQDRCSIHPISWRSNYGVFMELPFHITDDPYYFELSMGLDSKRQNDSINNCINWFDPNFDRGQILFVPDITIFHKGTATIFIEVVHTHPVPEKKYDLIESFFYNHHIQIYEIRAIDILKNTKIPESLPILKYTEF